VSWLEAFLHSYGLLAVGLGTFFEGETILVLAGLAAHRGYLDFSSVVLAAFVGSMTGDQLYFHIGRRHGEAFIARHPTWKTRVASSQAFLERHHIAFILGFRFLYGLRTVSPFAIGLSRVRVGRFVALNSVGALIWSVSITTLGYSVGGAAEVLIGRVKEIEGWLFLGVAGVGAIVWSIYFVRRRRALGAEGS